MKAFLLTFSLLPAIYLFAQPKIGIKAGISTSFTKITHTDNYIIYGQQVKTGGIFGILLDWPLGKKVAFRPELEYVAKGYKETSTFSGSSYTIPQTLPYIDLPLDIVYKTNNKNGKFMIGGGPVISFYILKGSSQYPFTDTDFGVNILTGYEWPIGFFISLNYTDGLKNVSASKDRISSLKNKYFGLCLGYIF